MYADLRLQREIAKKKDCADDTDDTDDTESNRLFSPICKIQFRGNLIKLSVFTLKSTGEGHYHYALAILYDLIYFMHKCRCNIGMS